MNPKILLILISSLAVMIGYQNCGPALKVADPEVASEQQAIVANALKPNTEWSLIKIESQGQPIDVPQNYQVRLNFIEIGAEPELMCAGGCGQQYDVRLMSNCSQGSGKYSISFNMETGFNRHEMLLNSINSEESCPFQEWDNFLIQSLNHPKLDTLVSHDSKSRLLVIQSGSNKLTFSKKK
jgi:hypothetical protein